jgi:hypothetical protein
LKLVNAEGTGDVALDSDEPIDVVRHGAAEVVVREAWPTVVVREIHRATRDHRDIESPRSGILLLRVGATAADNGRRRDENRESARRACLIEP